MNPETTITPLFSLHDETAMKYCSKCDLASLEMMLQFTKGMCWWKRKAENVAGVSVAPAAEMMKRIIPVDFVRKEIHLPENSDCVV